MGFFSYRCRGCGHPMLSPMATNKVNRWMSNVVALTEEGSRIVGTYDGYGRVDDDDLDSERADWWHRDCWELSGKPEYKSQARHAPDQGWFYNKTDHDMEKPTTVEELARELAKTDKKEKKRAEREQKLFAKWKKEREKKEKELKKKAG